ncbi:MAG: hypothetical protein GXP25_08445 [Planctomycetes bacterium]|nr:hypothetical protein [Planctomycetota bacterium]
MGNRFLDEWRTRVDIAIHSALRQQAEQPLLDVMLAATEGGDRTLGLLTLSCCDAAGGDAFGALNLAAAVEMIQATSRVATDPQSANACICALVAGAFEAALRSSVPDFMSAEIVLELARAAGARGMALRHCKTSLRSKDGAHRTSAPLDHGVPALFSAAARVGALGAYAAPHTLAALGNTGKHIGLAYQAVHDWLGQPDPASRQAKVREQVDGHLGHTWVEFGKALGRHSGSDLLLAWQEMVETSLKSKIQ